MRPIHYLKTIEPHYSKVKKGTKTAEIRIFNRDFRVGDKIVLLKYNLKTGVVQSKTKGIPIRITDILKSTDFAGLADGYCLISFKKEIK